MTTRLSLSSIGARIGLAVGVVLLGLLCVIGAGVLGLQRMERSITDLVSVGTVSFGRSLVRSHLSSLPLNPSSLGPCIGI